MERAFLAVAISPEVSRALADRYAWLGNFSSVLRIVPPRNYHITVRFLGTLDESRAEVICQAFAERFRPLGPLKLRVQGRGVFPSAEAPAVFWAAVGPTEPFEAVYQACEAALTPLGFRSEARPHVPHVTLARLGGGAGSAAPADFIRRWTGPDAAEAPIRIDTDRLTLFESVPGEDAPVYVPRGEFILRDGGRQNI